MPTKTLDPSSQLLQLVQQTRLGKRQVQKLSEALLPIHDLEAIAARLPATAIEAFACAAWLAGAPLKLSSISHFLPRLASPTSLTRIVSVTTGDRISTMMEMVAGRDLEEFQAALALFLCVELSGPDTIGLTVLAREVFYGRVCWASLVLLGEAATRLCDAEDCELAVEAMSYARSEHGSQLVDELRGVLRQPVSTLPSDGPQRAIPGQRVKKMEYLGCHLPILTRDGYLAESPLEAMAHDVSELDSRSLLAIHNRLAQSECWDVAARALDEMVSKGGDAGFRIEYFESLVRAGQTKQAHQQLESIRAGNDEPPADAVFELSLLDELPGSTLQKLNDLSLSGLRDPDRDELFAVALALLKHAPALGVIYARGALADIPDVEHSCIDDDIFEARARLGLPNDDPADDIRAALWRLKVRGREID